MNSQPPLSSLGLRARGKLVRNICSWPPVRALPKIPTYLDKERVLLGDGVLLNHYRKNLRAVVGSAAAPYGYTLSIWAAGAALVSVHGIPQTLAALTFVGGAVLGFAFVGGLAYGGIPGQMDQERGHALIWGSLHFVSVGLAVGAVTLAAYLIEGFVVWPLGGFLVTSIYLLVVGAESATSYLWEHRRD